MVQCLPEDVFSAVRWRQWLHNVILSDATLHVSTVRIRIRIVGAADDGETEDVGAAKLAKTLPSIWTLWQPARLSERPALAKCLLASNKSSDLLFVAALPSCPDCPVNTTL